MKTCSKCNESKPISDFGKHANERDGLRRDCRSCANAFSRAYYAAHHQSKKARNSATPAEKKARDVAYREANIENEKARNAAYRVANLEKVKARQAAYRAANPEKIKALGAAWRADNPDYHQAWVTSNPEKYKAWRAENKERLRIYCHTRRARKRDAGGKLSPGIAAKLFKLQRGKCACCGLPLGDDRHLDHIMPLSLGGTNTDDNIQLLRSTCNQQKHAKHPVDFMQSRGFLL